MMKKVAVIMGSDSDLPVVQGAISKLREFGVEVEAHVMSAHRTPEQAAAFSKNSRENGFGVIIAAAGKAAIWQAYWLHTPPFRSSESPSSPLLWMVWMPFWLLFRCLPAFRLPPLPLMERKMLLSWQYRCSR